MKNRNKVSEWVLRRRICWRNWCRMNRTDFVRGFWKEVNAAAVFIVGGVCLFWLIILWWQAKPH